MERKGTDELIPPANNQRFAENKANLSLKRRLQLAATKAGTSKMDFSLKKLAATQPKRDSRAGSIVNDCTYRLLAQGYTKEELDEYNQIFSMFDTDGSRSIGTTELETAMKSMGMNPNDAELENLIQEVDQDGNGEIDFEEFCDVMKRMTIKGHKTSWDDVIKQCFEVFDRSGSGSITDEDFHTILGDVGDIKDSNIIKSIFSEFDVDGNHMIDYAEFTNMVKNYMTDEDIESFEHKK